MSRGVRHFYPVGTLQQPLNRMEYRTKVCLRPLPDYLFQLPLATGHVERIIADVKTVSLGAPSYYKPEAAGKRTVEHIEAEVPGEYRRTAAKMDTALGHADRNGPVTRSWQSIERSSLYALLAMVKGQKRYTTSSPV